MNNFKSTEKYDKTAETYNKIANVSMAFMFIGILGVIVSIFSSIIIHDRVTSYPELFYYSILLITVSYIPCIIGHVGFNYFMEKGFNK